MGVKDLFQLRAVYEHSLALQQQCSNVYYHREQSHVFDLFISEYTFVSSSEQTFSSVVYKIQVLPRNTNFPTHSVLILNLQDVILKVMLHETISNNCWENVEKY